MFRGGQSLAPETVLMSSGGSTSTTVTNQIGLLNHDCYHVTVVSIDAYPTAANSNPVRYFAQRAVRSVPQHV